jgi:hypothetical protein
MKTEPIIPLFMKLQNIANQASYTAPRGNYVENPNQIFRSEIKFY